jgi:hypothetical protein
MNTNNLNKLFGGSSHDEVYDILNEMRKTKKFDYVCSMTENDTNFLDLTCEEAKILKFILKINLQEKDNKKDFIKDNTLNTSLLNNHLINFKDKLIIVLTSGVDVLGKKYYYYFGYRYDNTNFANDLKKEYPFFSYATIFNKSTSR